LDNYVLNRVFTGAGKMQEPLDKKIVDLTGGIEFMESTDFALDVDDVKQAIQSTKKKLDSFLIKVYGQVLDYEEAKSYIDKILKEDWGSLAE